VAIDTTAVAMRSVRRDLRTLKRVLEHGAYRIAK